MMLGMSANLKFMRKMVMNFKTITFYVFLFQLIKLNRITSIPRLHV